MRTGKKRRASRSQKINKNKQKTKFTQPIKHAQKQQVSAYLPAFFRLVGFPITRLLLFSLRHIHALYKKPQQFKKNLKISFYRLYDSFQKVVRSFSKLLTSSNKFRDHFKRTETWVKKHHAPSHIDSWFAQKLVITKKRRKSIKLALDSLTRKSLENFIIYKHKTDYTEVIRQKLVLETQSLKTKVDQLINKRADIRQHIQRLLQQVFHSLKAKSISFIFEVRLLVFLFQTRIRAFSRTVWSTLTTSWLVQSWHRFSNKVKSSLTITVHLKLRYVLIFLVIGGFIGSTGYFYQYILRDLPDASQLGTIQPELTTKIYDRNGILLYKIYRDENRSLVPLQEIPNHMIQATIAIEDQDFFQHPGFSVRGITRALKTNLTEDTVQGGSTITQQLIKNTLLTPEKTFERKVKEVILSFITEFYYSKDQILAMYLNQVPYGGSAYGVEEAAQMYFGKSIREVNLAEAAFLAGLTRAPTKYSPYGPHTELANERQKQVIRRMVEDGYITPEEGDSALKEKLAILPPKATLLAPHFVMYVRDLLADMYGSQQVDIGGLEVTTSLDLSLQNKAQEVVATEVSNLSSLRVTNGAALITNPSNGEILAMVGSVDYFNSANDGQVNVTIRERQPGSSVKPLMYSMALERGLSPATIIPDTPICYNIKGQPPYCPNNYDGNYHGKVSLRQALASSYNIPAVKTLAQFSVNDLIDHAEELGITTWKDRNRFGLALALGGGEVKMVDMAVAYGVFANQGRRVDLTPILEIKNSEGKVIAQRPCVNPEGCVNRQVLDPRVAYQISDILSDNQARSQAFGLNSVLHIPGQQIAVKTGTTNSLRDNWTIGYSQDRLVTVWVGNNDNTPMSYIASGITGASPIWNKIMTAMLNPEHPNHFEVPTNLAKVQICTITGELACNGCPSREEYFIAGTEPKSHCSSDAIANILNPKPPENNP